MLDKIIAIIGIIASNKIHIFTIILELYFLPIKAQIIFDKIVPNT